MFPSSPMVSGEKNKDLNYYVAYGTPLESELDLGSFLIAGGTSRDPVRVIERSAQISQQYLEQAMLHLRAHGRELALYSDIDSWVPIVGQNWFFEVKQVVRFHWVKGTGSIEFERQEHCTKELLAFWLIHIFLPIYFTLEGTYEFIHACAVEVAGATILFTGPSRGGKSTMTDYFLKQGHILVSDDKVATYGKDKQYFALPSHPNHRPYRNFEDMGNRVTDYSPDARLLNAIYALQAEDSAAEVKIEEVTGHEKFAQILPSYLFDFPLMKEKRLNYLAGMVSTVPIFRVGMPWNLNRLGEVHDSICEHQETNSG